MEINSPLAILQYPHQEAQKSRSTSLPLREDKEIALPDGSFKVKSGAFSPIVKENVSLEEKSTMDQKATSEALKRAVFT